MLNRVLPSVYRSRLGWSGGRWSAGAALRPGCFEADADGGDPDRHILKLVAGRAPRSPCLIADLWYIPDSRERIQGVDVRGPLGRLATLAGTLTERYRWRLSGATTFVLTGRTRGERLRERSQ